MSRWFWFWMCAILGAVLLVCGLLVPIHLRAVDVRVLVRAGKNSTGLLQRGEVLVEQKKLGAAQMLLQAARQERLPDWEELGLAVNNLAKQGSTADDALRSEVMGAAASSEDFNQPLTDVVIGLQSRQRALALLKLSSNLAAQELLQSRELTNTVIFPPSQSASGQAFDAAVSVCGLLLDEGKLAPELGTVVFTLASQARLNPQPLEQLLMDFMSLGQRLNWDQMTVLLAHVQDADTLRRVAEICRRAESQLPLLFAAVDLSGQPAEVSRYLMEFSLTGLGDLGTSLRFGAGGINELLRRRQRVELEKPGLIQRVESVAPFKVVSRMGVELAWQLPWMAMAIKWLCYLLAGFLVAAALHFARPEAPPLEQPLQVRGFHFAREILFGLGFLLVVLILSEPFLAQESQKVDFTFRLRLPTVGGTVPAGTHINVKPQIMNQLSLLTLLVFFVLQGLIYTACVVKLAEIRRQRVPARVKLRLLENEEHLFDAGLYLGFVGTIVSLILVSLGIIQFSLMAAYSSTSFGIIFVSFFKIFHLRPARRKLLLEAEAASPERVPMVGAAPSLMTSP